MILVQEVARRCYRAALSSLGSRLGDGRIGPSRGLKGLEELKKVRSESGAALPVGLVEIAGQGDKKSQSVPVKRLATWEESDESVILSGEVFDVPIRKDIVHTVVKWQLAKRRQGTHGSRTYATIARTKKKPWPQKGTGNARQGSRKTPQFLGGVKIHGPQPRDYEYSLNKKIRRAGLQVALSAKVVDGGLHVIDSLAVPSHKTASLLPVIAQVDPESKRQSILFVNAKKSAEEDDDAVQFSRGIQNIEGINTLPVEGLNVYDIVRHKHLVITVSALSQIETRLTRPIKR